ncbi:MAG: hypothetical protein HGB06_08150 [Chlorobaculum sp.]|jgi:hypothetical protein|nr:hypothetical protein [Chlorobaculum sp.]
MTITRKATLSKEGQLALDALRKAVANALEKKRRLGQYAVIWQDGKPTIIGGEIDRGVSTQPSSANKS